MRPETSKNETNAAEDGARPAHAEAAEVATWMDPWRAVPPPVALENHMHHENVAGGTAMVFDNAPHWMFNRVLGFGLSRPATDPDVEALVALYDDKSLDFAMSLAPHAQPTHIGRRLLARGLERINVRARMTRGPEPCPDHAGAFRVERIGTADARIFAGISMTGLGAPPAWEPVFRSAVACQAAWSISTRLPRCLPIGCAAFTER